MFEFRNFNTRPFVGQCQCSPIIEGAEVYDALCPVSSLTHRRANPLCLLEKLANDPVKSRLLNTVLQVLPTVASDDSLSPDDKLNMLKMRLHSGTPAEDAVYVRQMETVLEDYLDMVDSAKAEAAAAKAAAAAAAAPAEPQSSPESTN